MSVDVGVFMCVGGFPLVQQLDPERLSKSVCMGGKGRVGRGRGHTTTGRFLRDPSELSEMPTN